MYQQELWQTQCFHFWQFPCYIIPIQQAYKIVGKYAYGFLTRCSIRNAVTMLVAMHHRCYGVPWSSQPFGYIVMKRPTLPPIVLASRAIMFSISLSVRARVKAFSDWLASDHALPFDFNFFLYFKYQLCQLTRGWSVSYVILMANSHLCYWML